MVYDSVSDPGKNLHADPDPDPGGIRGVKGFFHVSGESEQLKKDLMKIFSAPNS